MEGMEDFEDGQDGTELEGDEVEEEERYGEWEQKVVIRGVAAGNHQDQYGLFVRLEIYEGDEEELNYWHPVRVIEGVKTTREKELNKEVTSLIQEFGCDSLSDLINTPARIYVRGFNIVDIKRWVEE